MLIKCIWIFPVIMLISCASATKTHPEIRQESRRLLTLLEPLQLGSTGNTEVVQQLERLDRLDKSAQKIKKYKVTDDSIDGKNFTGNLNLAQKTIKQLYQEFTKLGVIEGYSKFDRIKIIVVSVIEQKNFEQTIAACLINDRNFTIDSMVNNPLILADEIHTSVLKDADDYSSKNLKNYFSNLSIENKTFLLVYYTGHGSMLDDGSAHYLHTSNIESGNYVNTGLSLNLLKSEFIRVISESYDSTGMLVVDACHATPEVNIAQEYRNGIIFTGNSLNTGTCKIGRFGSNKFTQKKYGVFTYYLFNAIKNIHLVTDYDNDGFIRINELCYYVQQQVKDYSSKWLRSKQIPNWYFGKYADARLVLYQK